MIQAINTASRNWKRQGNRFPPKTSRKECSPDHIQILFQLSETSLGFISYKTAPLCCLKPLNCGNLLQQQQRTNIVAIFTAACIDPFQASVILSKLASKSFSFLAFRYDNMFPAYLLVSSQNLTSASISLVLLTVTSDFKQKNPVFSIFVFSAALTTTLFFSKRHPSPPVTAPRNPVSSSSVGLTSSAPLGFTSSPL